MFRKCCSAQNLGRRHERHLQAVLHRDERGQQRDDRLPGADVALQQPVHRLRPLQIVDDLLERLALSRRQPERQHARAPIRECDRPRGPGPPSRSSDVTTAPRQHARSEKERLLEDQPLLRRRGEPVQRVEPNVRRRKMRRQQRRRRGPATAQTQECPRQRIRQIGGQALERIVHESALHLRRHRAGLLVDRHDPPGVNGLAFFFVEDLVLRVGQLQAAVPRISTGPNSTTCWPAANTSRRNG